MDEEVIQEATETGTTSAIVDVPAPKLKRARNIEELDKLSPKAMTENEKVKYIEALRDQIVASDVQIQTLKDTAQSAFEVARQREQALNEIKRDAAAKLAFAKQAMSTCYSSVLLLTNDTAERK